MKRKLINPFTDAAFKLLFGTEKNKVITIGFLNIILKPESRITDVKFLNTELIEMPDAERTCRVDVLCETEDGTKLIVEMQQGSQINFTNRLVYYGSRLIDMQGQKGDWDYPLKKIHIISLMNFIYEIDNPVFRNDVLLTSRQTGKIFNNSLEFTLLQLPCLDNWNYNDLETDDKKLVYLLKQMENSNMDHDTLFKMVDETKEGKELKEFYKKFLDIADYESLSKEEKFKYDRALDNYNSLRCTYAYHLQQGYEQGVKQGIEQGLNKGKAEGAKQQAIEVARSMKQDSMPIEMIAKYTGLKIEEIELL